MIYFKLKLNFYKKKIIFQFFIKLSLNDKKIYCAKCLFAS